MAEEEIPEIPGSADELIEKINDAREPIPSSFSKWAGLTHEITAGEISEDGDIVASHEPLVKGVAVPESLSQTFGRKANVRVLGDFDRGYTVRVRGRWPTMVQRTYYIAPQDNDTALLVAETTKSKSFLFRPRRFEDDFTKAPKDETFDDLMPAMDEDQQKAFVDLLNSTAIESAKRGLNKAEVFMLICIC
jgi:hypothetical protein